MYTITPNQQQYLFYELEDQTEHSQLSIVPERGALVTQWRIRDNDILYFDEERFANPQNSPRGGIPVLFPICGNLSNNTYEYKGASYNLPQHGFARDLNWEVSEQSTRKSASMTLTLKSNELTYQSYPFEFRLDFSYALQGRSLRVEQSYTNLSDEMMPFSTGLHAYFAASDKAQLAFDIPAYQYLDQNNQTTHPYTGAFDFSQDEIDAAFTSLTRNFIYMTDHQRQMRLKMSFSEIYSTLVLWSVKNKSFICLEPWTAPRNALNTGNQLIYLGPSSTYQTRVILDVDFF